MIFCIWRILCKLLMVIVYCACASFSVSRPSVLLSLWSVEFHEKINKLFGVLQDEKHASYCWVLSIVRQKTFVYRIGFSYSCCLEIRTVYIHSCKNWHLTCNVRVSLILSIGGRLIFSLKCSGLKNMDKCYGHVLWLYI